MKRYIIIFFVFYLLSSDFSEVCAIQQLKKTEQKVEVSALEDLMREHGMLDRLLLIYEEIMRRIEMNELITAFTVHEASGLIKHFIEEYHERLEEDYIFTRFEEARVLPEVIATLRDQHQQGRRLTGIIRDASKSETAFAGNKTALLHAMYSFIRMYRVHEAWEDTLVFPQFHSLITADEYEKLGDLF